MSDNKEIGLLYETVVISVNTPTRECDDQTNVADILAKVNKLISNKKAFNDTCGLESLNTLKSYIESL